MFFKPENGLFLTDALIFLKTLKGKRISEMSRLAEGGVSRFLKNFKNFSESDVFEFCSGPIFLNFDCGLCLGFGDSPKDQSIIVWEQKSVVANAIIIGHETLDEVDTLIDSRNPRYVSTIVSTFIGAEISSVSILKVKNSDPGRRRFRNERGVSISTLDGRTLFFSLQMNQGAPGHCVLTTRMDIRPELKKDLEEIKA
jgi:hypothetical protein